MTSSAVNTRWWPKKLVRPWPDRPDRFCRACCIIVSDTLGAVELLLLVLVTMLLCMKPFSPSQRKNSNPDGLSVVISQHHEDSVPGTEPTAHESRIPLDLELPGYTLGTSHRSIGHFHCHTRAHSRVRNTFTHNTMCQVQRALTHTSHPHHNSPLIQLQI